MNLYVFSDGLEQSSDNARQMSYDFVIYQRDKQLASFSAALSPISHVFDAEAVEACQALECTVKLLPCTSSGTTDC